MERWEGAFITSMEIIETSHISAIEQFALRNITVNAKVPADAGQYVEDRISQNSHCSVEETLRSIRADMKTLALKLNREHPVAPDIDAAVREREGQRCCVTGWRKDVKPTYIISPSILEDADLKPGGSLRPLFEAILSRDGVDQLFKMLESRGTENELKNLWLMSPSVRKAFRGGHVSFNKSPHLEKDDGKVRNLGENGGWEVQRFRPEAISPAWLGGSDSFYNPPTTKDPKKYPLPTRFLLSTHKRISSNLHVYTIEEQIRRGWPPLNKEPWTLGLVPRLLLRRMLMVLPRFARIGLYKFIDRQAEYWDPEQKGSYIKYLPLGLVLKTGRAHTANEANALLVVEKHTSVNAPRLIDSVMMDESSGFILMTRVFGVRLDHVYYRTTFEERDQIAKELAEWIAEMRRIPNESSYLIADTLGNPISDHQFEHETWGPFNSVGDFTNHLVRNVFDIQQHKDKRPLSVLQEKKHEVCFTHSDLHMSNIFINQGHLCGLIDFENAGFKPEYWEFTRALWPYGANRRESYIYRRVFEGKYDEEWEAEAFILSNSPMFV